MEEKPLFYSPYFPNSNKANDHLELFPEMSAEFDFTLDRHADTPSSMWCVRQIGSLQAKLEKKAGKRDLRALGMKDLFNICNEVFGFNGWRTDILETEVSHYEEIDEGLDGGGVVGSDDGDVPKIEEEEVRYDSQGLTVIDSGVAKVKYSVELTTRVRVTLKDQTYHESCGVARCSEMRIKALAFSRCKKESVNNAIKNCVLELREVLVEYEQKRNNGYYV